jgi:hypothetical protein
LLAPAQIGGDRVAISLLCPGEDLFFRAGTVMVLFGLGEAETTGVTYCLSPDAA